MKLTTLVITMLLALTCFACSNQTPSIEITSTPDPKPPALAVTPTLVPTATPTLVPAATPRPTTAPVPTATATATPTTTPTATPTATPTPTPTPMPVASQPIAEESIPLGDSRYGVVLHTKIASEQQYFLDFLGTPWFIDYGYDVTTTPTGYSKLLYVSALPGPTRSEIQKVAAIAPGSVWYILGEPNRRLGFEASNIVDQLHNLYMMIKEIDPTAKITSPSLLNWDFTCVGCSGYTSGHAWVDEFRTEYKTRYGTEPPIDIWAIDVYPIDWSTLPTTDSTVALNQVKGMREYLNDIPQYANTPIWITEFSLHWGWDAWEFVKGCSTPKPTGSYKTQEVVQYLKEVYDWLETNSNELMIERWFTFITYSDLTICHGDAYAGISLFEKQTSGSDLTPVGRYFQGRSTN